MAALFSPLTLHSHITSIRRAADPAHRGLLGNKTHTQSSQWSYMSVNRWVFTRCRYLLFVGLSTRRLFSLCEVAALQLSARLKLPQLQRPVLTNTITSLKTQLSVWSDKTLFSEAGWRAAQGNLQICPQLWWFFLVSFGSHLETKQKKSRCWTSEAQQFQLEII